MNTSKNGLPTCERCGRTIPPGRRERSSYCTDRCASAQERADTMSAAMEEEVQRDAFEARPEGANCGCGAEGCPGHPEEPARG